MRSGSPDDLLLAVAKKKPHLQAFIDALPTTTVEEIQSLQQPVWIRKALISLKSRDGKGQKEFIEDHIVVSRIPDPELPVREWTGESTFIGSSRTTVDYKIEICTGDLFQVLEDTQEIMQGSTFILLTPQQWTLMLQRSQVVATKTRVDYDAMNQAKLSKKFA